MGERKWYKPALLALMIFLIGISSVMQGRLNRERDRLGLTHVEVLKNAPPVLAFTTVALGGFRGLIANALWMRATDLQDDGKYFEMVQLSDWITKLQPHFTIVWINQAWNMAYNISVKFESPVDRWHWVERGIELLRDEGLKYNPGETLMYRELAWFFQHKLGQNLDDAHLYYKQSWGEEMEKVFPGGKVDYETLIRPITEDQKSRSTALRDRYKMDPAVMQDVDKQLGPFEWRLPEAHAVYWAWLGLKKAKREELITLRRVIYQSMQLAFQRGRLIENKVDKSFEFGPNLEIIPHTNQAYEEMMRDDAEYRDHIKTGHRNFLRDAVYFLYVHNRKAGAETWFKYLKEKYPDARIDKPPVSIQGMSLDDYCVARVMEEVGDTSVDKTKSMLMGVMSTAYYNLAIGEDDQFTGLSLLAQRVRNRYESRTKGSEGRIGLPSIDFIKQEVLKGMLAPEGGMPPQLAAQLRSRLNLPATALTTTNAPATAPAPPTAPK